MTGPAKVWKVGIAGILIFGVVAVVWCGVRFWPTPQPVSSRVLLLNRPMEIVSGVYLLGRLTPGAAYAVETSDGLVLVDSGLEDDASGVLDQLNKLHLDSSRLRAILLTHVHADHSLGAERLRTLTGAKVYAGRDDCQPLRAGEPRVAFFSKYYMPERTVHPTTVDVELAGDEVLTFGDTRFVALATPGHTPGSVCYLLERPGLRALFTGDVIMHLSPTGGNPLGTYAVSLPPSYRGNACDYLASLRRLRELEPVPDLVLPGHPRDDPSPQNSRLDPERWYALLDNGIAELEKVLARYQADGANFLDGNPKQLLPGLHYLGGLDGSAVYALHTSKGFFIFDAPGGPVLVDFLDKQFQKLSQDRFPLTAVLLTSAETRATAGLAALVQRTHCQVIAPKARLEEVRHLCPAGTRVFSEEDLPARDWFQVRMLPVAGRGLAPLAYQLSWAKKTVLVSGRIPVKMDPPVVEQLLHDLAAPGGDVGLYRESLRRLAKVKPDLWLPAVPVHGQNANLYDDDWPNILGDNGQLFR